MGFRSVATHILPVVIEEFRQQYPGISVSIGEGNDVRGAEEILRRGEADIGFTYLPVNEAFDANVTLADEKAMSSRNSPYRNVSAFTDFVLERLGEKA